MRYVFAVGAVALVGLALLATGSDAQNKKKDTGDDLPPRADEVPKFLKMLSASSADDRALAMKKLGLRGMVNYHDVKDAIEPLMKALEKDADAKVRAAAARALGNIQPEAQDTVPLLTKTVKSDKVMDVRLAATVALGQYGADAKEALPTLRDFATEINDKKSPQAQTVFQAIKSISGKKK
jgi:HEAT repeat protein